MEEFQEREYEFFRKLEEERIDRSRLLKRGLLAGFGLTILSTPASALALRRRIEATPPLRATTASLKEIVAEAKKEGRLNTIALPPDWANYGEIMRTFSRKYGIPITNDNPDGPSAQENQAVRSLKGDPRAPDVLDVSPPFAIAGANEGLYAKYFTRNFNKVPRAMKDGRGFWVADYWGVISFGVNRPSSATCRGVGPTCSSPSTRTRSRSTAARSRPDPRRPVCFSAAIANGGSLSNVGPGIDFFARLKSAGNFIPVQATPQTIASGQTPIVVDWDYLNLAYVKEFPSAKIRVSVPSNGVYGAYYCQAINATGPHPWAARLWQEFLYSDQGQLLWLKGYSHPALFTDLVGEGDPKNSWMRCRRRRPTQR